MWLLIISLVVLAVGFVAFTGAPYVPTLKRDLKNLFNDLYQLKPSDVLVDIGSGDGVVLREVSRRGARAVGYEIHPILVMISKLISMGDKNVTIKLANFWRTNIPDDTTVVYTFGDSRDIDTMYMRIQNEANRLNRDVYFISYAFEVKCAESINKSGAYFLYKLKPLQST